MSSPRKSTKSFSPPQKCHKMSLEGADGIIKIFLPSLLGVLEYEVKEEEEDLLKASEGECTCSTTC